METYGALVIATLVLALASLLSSPLSLAAAALLFVKGHRRAAGWVAVSALVLVGTWGSYVASLWLQVPGLLALWPVCAILGGLSAAMGAAGLRTTRAHPAAVYAFVVALGSLAFGGIALWPGTPSMAPWPLHALGLATLLWAVLAGGGMALWAALSDRPDQEFA